MTNKDLDFFNVKKLLERFIFLLLIILYFATCEKILYCESIIFYRIENFKNLCALKKSYGLILCVKGWPFLILANCKITPLWNDNFITYLYWQPLHFDRRRPPSTKISLHKDFSSQRFLSFLFRFLIYFAQFTKNDREKHLEPMENSVSLVVRFDFVGRRKMAIFFVADYWKNAQTLSLAVTALWYNTQNLDLTFFFNSFCKDFSRFFPDSRYFSRFATREKSFRDPIEETAEETDLLEVSRIIRREKKGGVFSNCGWLKKKRLWDNFKSYHDLINSLCASIYKENLGI